MAHLEEEQLGALAMPVRPQNTQRKASRWDLHKIPTVCQEAGTGESQGSSIASMSVLCRSKKQGRPVSKRKKRADSHTPTIARAHPYNQEQ